MNFDYRQQQQQQPSLYAVSPESIQPQFISPGSIQPQNVFSGGPQPFISPGGIQPQFGYPGGPQPFISPGSIQPQPIYPPMPFPPYPQPFPPYQPGPSYPQFPIYPPTTVGGCNQKWATVRLRDGRTLYIYVTSISENSIGGFLPNGRQIALDLDEIVEMTC